MKETLLEISDYKEASLEGQCSQSFSFAISQVILKHAGTFKRFVREYKGLLTRIQKRLAIKKPKTPFVLEDVTKFLDRKESK